RAVGLDDRGVLAPGYKADLNVIDYDALRLREPRMVRDLPAGGGRLLQRADGYRWAVVSGRITYVNGDATGALPGRLVRGAQPARREGTACPRPRSPPRASRKAASGAPPTSRTSRAGPSCSRRTSRTRSTPRSGTRSASPTTCSTSRRTISRCRRSPRA